MLMTYSIISTRNKEVSMMQTKKDKIDYILHTMSEHIESILNEEGVGLEALTPSEVISLAFELATTDQFNLSQLKYKTPIASVNKNEAFMEMSDGTYQPLFEVSHGDENDV